MLKVMFVIQLRRGTRNDLWYQILLPGQCGLETDTGQMKVGDGVSEYRRLSYVGADPNTYTPDGIEGDTSSDFHILMGEHTGDGSTVITLRKDSIDAEIISEDGQSYDPGDLTIRARSVTYIANQTPASLGTTVRGIATPEANDGAANKEYVDTQIQTILLKMYPVGSIYMSVVNTNPSEYFGGTWVAWGSGRVPVGVDASDTDFNTAEKSAGYKTYYYQHSHRVSSHSHTMSHTHTINSHTHTTANHTLTVDEMPSHTHTLNNAEFKIQWDGINRAQPANGTSYRSGSTSPTITMNASGGGQPHNHGNTGGTSLTTNTSSISDTGAASPMVTLESTYINVLQPYITCYMWKRTA